MYSWKSQNSSETGLTVSQHAPKRTAGHQMYMQMWHVLHPIFASVGQQSIAIATPARVNLKSGGHLTNDACKINYSSALAVFAKWSKQT